MTPTLRRVQSDFYYRLLGAEDLANIAFILMRKAATDSEIESQLKTQAGRNGKVGVCAFVEMPELGVEDPNVPGPRTLMRMSVLVLEHPTINAQSNGTGTNAEEVAVDILQQLHHFMPHSVTQVWIGTPEAIVPDMSFPGLVGYRVTVQTFLGLSPQTKVALPAITRGVSGFPTTATITCATSGATIRYTTDGSYPAADNAAAATYSAPVAITAAKEVRAVASKTGSQQSDAARLNIT